MISRGCSTRAVPATTWVACCARIEAPTTSSAQVLAKKPVRSSRTTRSCPGLRADQGRGRRTPPSTTAPAAVLHPHTDVTAPSGCPRAPSMIMPADNVRMTVELITPIALRDRPALRHPPKVSTPWAPAPSQRSWSDPQIPSQPARWWIPPRSRGNANPREVTTLARQRIRIRSRHTTPLLDQSALQIVWRRPSAPRRRGGPVPAADAH